MKKFAKIVFQSSGCAYEVAMERIGGHRVEKLAGEPPMELAANATQDERAQHKADSETYWAKVQTLVNETTELFEDPIEAALWCRENMVWEDFRDSARVVEFKSPVRDLTEDAEFVDFYDEKTQAEEPQGQAAGDIPVDMFLSLLSQKDKNLMVSVMADHAGKPVGAFMYVKGDAEAINEYIMLCQQMAEMRKKVKDMMVNLLKDAGDNPVAAFIYVKGVPDQVMAYVQLCTQLSEQMVKIPDGINPRKKFPH